jgi:hypothetical protein
MRGLLHQFSKPLGTCRNSISSLATVAQTRTASTDQTQKHRKLQKYISPTVSFRTKEDPGRRIYRRSRRDQAVSLQNQDRAYVNRVAHRRD